VIVGLVLPGQKQGARELTRRTGARFRFERVPRQRDSIDSELGLPDVSSEHSHKALHQDWQ
jgi:hypothetical protein